MTTSKTIDLSIEDQQIIYKIIKGFCIAQDIQTKNKNGCIAIEVIKNVICNINTLPEINETYVQLMIGSFIVAGVNND